MTTAVTIRRVTRHDATAAWALRLEMVADPRLAYLVRRAARAGQRRAACPARVAWGGAGGPDATFVAGITGGRQRRRGARVGGFPRPAEPDCTVLVAVYVAPAHRG